jgi:hypothetical protein
VGGLSASTLITLALIPAMYSLFHPEPTKAVTEAQEPISASADVASS